MSFVVVQITSTCVRLGNLSIIEWEKVKRRSKINGSFEKINEKEGKKDDKRQEISKKAKKERKKERKLRNL